MDESETLGEQKKLGRPSKFNVSKPLSLRLDERQLAIIEAYTSFRGLSSRAESIRLIIELTGQWLEKNQGVSLPPASEGVTERLASIELQKKPAMPQSGGSQSTGHSSGQVPKKTGNTPSLTPVHYLDGTGVEVEDGHKWSSLAGEP